MLPHSRISFDESLKKYGSSESFKFVAPLESCKRGTPLRVLESAPGSWGSNPPPPGPESSRARRVLGVNHPPPGTRYSVQLMRFVSHGGCVAVTVYTSTVFASDHGEGLACRGLVVDGGTRRDTGAACSQRAARARQLCARVRRADRGTVAGTLCAGTRHGNAA